jgi:hypothetical protein
MDNSIVPLLIKLRAKENIVFNTIIQQQGLLSTVSNRLGEPVLINFDTRTLSRECSKEEYITLNQLHFTKQSQKQESLAQASGPTNNTELSNFKADVKIVKLEISGAGNNRAGRLPRKEVLKANIRSCGINRVFN